eukprot:jgi/Orpsp1_1/1186450/evm.model.d7180000050677.1
MTTVNCLITPDERLNRSNYEDWYPTISSILESKGILKYTESDIIKDLKDEVKNGTKDQQELENAKKEDSKARAFILTSITKE